MFLSVSPPSCFYSFSTFCCFHQRRHRHTGDFESRRGFQSRSGPRPQSGRGPFYMVALFAAALYVCWTYIYLSISFLSSSLLDFTLSLTHKRAPSPSSPRRSPTLPAARARKPRPAMVRSQSAPGVMPLEANVHYAAPKGRGAFPNVPLLFPRWTTVHQPIRKNHNVKLEIYINSFLAFLAFLWFSGGYNFFERFKVQCLKIENRRHFTSKVILFSLISSFFFFFPFLSSSSSFAFVPIISPPPCLLFHLLLKQVQVSLIQDRVLRVGWIKSRARSRWLVV